MFCFCFAATVLLCTSDIRSEDDFDSKSEIILNKVYFFLL